MDDLAALVVNFTANIDAVSNAGDGVVAVFERLVGNAAESSSAITEALTGTTEGFSALTEAATAAGVDIGDGMLVAYDQITELGTAGEEAASSLSGSLSSVNFESLQSGIESLAASISDAVAQIDAQIDSIGTTAEASATKASTSFSGFNLSGMVNQIGLTVFSLQNIANVGQQVASSLLGPAMSAEATQTSFSNLLGSASQAAKVLDQLNTFAAQTQFKTQDIDLAASTMLGFGFKAQQIVPDLRAVGDALTAVGRGTPAEMQSVVNILGKISTQGKLTQGDITQLGAHGINAMQLLEQATGLSQTALETMIKKGTLPAAQAIDDLTKGIEKNPIYSGGMAKQAGTLSGLISTMQSNWQIALASFGSPIIKSLEGTMNDLGNILASSAFKDFATGVGQGIANVLGQIQHAVSGIDFKVLGQDVQQVGEWAQKSLVPALQQAAPNFERLGGAIGTLVSTALPPLIQGAETIIPPLIQIAGIVAGNLATAIPPVVGFFRQWGPIILTTALSLSAFFVPALINTGVQSAIAGGKVAVSFVTNVIQSGMAGWEAAGKLATYVGQLIASGIQAAASGIKIAASFVANLVASGAQAVVAGAQIAASFIANMVTAGAQAVVAGSQIVASFVGSLIEAATQAAITAGAFLADLIPAVASFVAGALVAAATAIPAVLAGFGAWIVGALGVAAANIAAFWPIYLVIGAIALAIGIVILIVKNWGAIVSWLQGVWSVVSGFFQHLWSDVTGFFQKFGLDILEILLGPVGLIMHFWQPITQFFAGLWAGIVAVFSGIGTWFHDRFVQAYQAVTSVFINLANWFHDHVWQPIADKFSSVFTNLKNTASGIWSSITAGFRIAFDDLIGFVNSAIDRINGVTSKVGIPAIPHIPMLAQGGIVPPGGAAIAGETGKPELVLGGMSGATVVGVSQTAALIAAGSQAALSGQQGGIAGASGGQITVTVPLVVNGRELARATIDDFGEALLRQIRSSGNPRGGLA